MTTFGAKAYDALAALRSRKNGQPITRDEWVATIDELVAVEAIFRKRKPSSKRPKPGRPRNPLFDALAVGTGTRDLSKLTRNGGRVIGVALADILEVAPDLTEQEIERVIRAYKSAHPTWPCTAMAIAKHWAEFTKSAPTNLSKRDVYVEPTVPWREVAAQIFPQSKTWIDPHDFATRPWLEIGDSCRLSILKAVYPSP